MELCQGIKCEIKSTCLCYLKYVSEFNNQKKYPLRGGGPWAAHCLCRVDSKWYTPVLIDLNQMFRDPTLLGVSIYFDRITDLVECFE